MELSVDNQFIVFCICYDMNKWFANKIIHWMTGLCLIFLLNNRNLFRARISSRNKA